MVLFQVSADTRKAANDSDAGSSANALSTKERQKIAEGVSVWSLNDSKLVTSSVRVLMTIVIPLAPGRRWRRAEESNPHPVKDALVFKTSCRPFSRTLQCFGRRSGSRTHDLFLIRKAL